VCFRSTISSKNSWTKFKVSSSSMDWSRKSGVFSCSR